jgi:hypothetical protein
VTAKPLIDFLFAAKVSAVVCDGITISHPCCNVPNCTVALKDCKKDRFCPRHLSRNFVCAVDDCEKPIQPDYKTCSDPAHRELETIQKQRNTANFQTRSRLERKAVSAPPDEATLEELANGGEAPDEGIEEGVCPQKSDKKFKARLGRRQTSTEQIMARPCGIIVARATFYHSESIPQVVVSPHNPLLASSQLTLMS